MLLNKHSTPVSIQNVIKRDVEQQVSQTQPTLFFILLIILIHPCTCEIQYTGKVFWCMGKLCVIQNVTMVVEKTFNSDVMKLRRAVNLE